MWYDRIDRFEWDEEKNLNNMRKHGIDFLDATHVFQGRVYSYSSPRDDEMREAVVGFCDGKLITVIITMRSNTCRIISARRARKKEREAYESHTQIYL